jgi:uncharacterized glyoxalase superfamily protein PhnB
MTSTIIPCLRYRDAPRMIEWLCQAFGFERHLVVEDGKGGIAHAQLTLGPGMIMLGSARGDNDAFGRRPCLLLPRSGGTPLERRQLRSLEGRLER